MRDELDDLLFEQCVSELREARNVVQLDRVRESMKVQGVWDEHLQTEYCHCVTWLLNLRNG